MAVFRKEKKKNYTEMSNHHLKNPQIRRPSSRRTGTGKAAIKRMVIRKCANCDSETENCLLFDCHCYMLTKAWTGNFCKYFEKAVLPIDPKLETALTDRDTSLRQKICPVCGKAYLPTTSQVYCSAQCRVAARRKQERERKRRARKNTA